MTGVPFFEWPKMTKEYKRKVIRAEKIDRFINQTSGKLILGEFLAKRLPTGPINRNKSLREIREINMVELLLDSEYKDIAESMSSNQLASLSSMFSKDFVKGHFPKDIVRNRALARSKSAQPFQSLVLNYVTMYLSPSEKSLLPNDLRIDELDKMLENYQTPGATPMIVYAAIAEVLAVRGFDKALEVASELKHLGRAAVKDLKVYESTVALIAEALNEKDDELPFGWAAQMSEHSWVLSSHIPKRIEIALKV